MKKSTKQVLMGIALSALSCSVWAQCPTTLSLNISSNYTTGDVTVSQVASPISTSSTSSNYYSIYDANYNYYDYANSVGANGTITFSNVPSGVYQVCVSVNDSIANPNCSYIQACSAVTVTNTINPNNCQASFTSYTDSNTCVTHLFNTTACPTSTVYFTINGNIFDASGVNTATVSLSAGYYYVSMNALINGQTIDSTGHWITVSCGTGTLNPPTCSASFYQYTDSGCVTHFVNTSAGVNLTSQWYIDGNTYYSDNVDLILPDNNYYVQLFNLSNGNFCDSTAQFLTISCPSSSVNPNCVASFYSYTDSSCVTHFYNTSSGFGTSPEWSINGNLYYSNDVDLALSNGTYDVRLYNYVGGTFCDSTRQYVTVACNTNTTNPNYCSANANLQIFGDSANPGNYFAYNLSSGTGNLSYLWNFGDGTTSTQQYPFHQYAVPGQYIVCLTVSATNGTTTCTDTQCDSSSVQRIAAGFYMSKLNVITPAIATGIKDGSSIKSFNAYPNPLLDELTVEVELAKNNTKLSYRLVDALGKVVASNNINDSKTTINTSNLDKGFYFLTITNEQGNAVKTAKLVK